MATKTKSKAVSPWEGKKAPAFSLKDETDTKRSLSEFKGQYVLLYFYPKDMTPGCTTQAQTFRDKMKELKKLDVQVLGLSCDDVESHKKFKDKHKLNFPLLADIDRKVVEKYGVWVEKNMYGRKYMGIQRDAFLINPSGKIIKHYIKVKPAENADLVIKEVKNYEAS